MNANQSNSRILNTVMRRVRIIRVLRPVASTTTLACGLLFLSLLGIGKEVFVAQVFENMPGNVAALGTFFISAFANTTLLVQGLSLTVLAAGVWFLRDVAQALTPPAISPVSV